jgi:crotonobetainyl-CoA:carnitine CoA-transferase CaiB-like acyl-CoA transferase
MNGQPLKGLIVLTLAEQYPGPFATLLFADLGADVIIVERPDGGDPSRQMPIFHDALNRNKRSVALNLKSDDGRAAFLRLSERAHILLEGFRPGTMARLGLSREQVAGVNPSLIYVSVSAFGQTGPYRERPAHDLSLQAIGGLFFSQASRAPFAVPDHALADLSAALFTAVAALAALRARESTGTGAHVDISMADGVVSLMTMYLAPHMAGRRADTDYEPGLGVYRCADDRLLTLSVAHEDTFWRALCATLDMPDVVALRRPERLRDAGALRARIAAAIGMHSLEHWAQRLEAAGVPWGPVNGLDEVVSDPHFRARGLFVDVPAAESSPSARHVRQPALFDGVAGGPTRPCPRLGQHTREVLTWIGYTGAEIDRMAVGGAVACG